MFLAKLDAGGNVLWAKSPIGTGNEDTYDMVSDSYGNIYITGYFNDQLTFDNTMLSTNGQTDVFVVAYDSSGNVIWTKSAGGPNGDNGFGIAIDALSNVYLTGYFKSSTISFGTSS